MKGPSSARTHRQQRFHDRYGPCAVVTGASSGIARQLTEAGFDLVPVARREELLRELAADLAGRHAVAVRTLPAGAQTARAAAHMQAGSPERAFAMLDALDPAPATGYQPYWVVWTHCLHRTGAAAEAARSAQVAMGLTGDPAVRRHLAAALARWRAPRAESSCALPRAAGPVRYANRLAPEPSCRTGPARETGRTRNTEPSTAGRRAAGPVN